MDIRLTMEQYIVLEPPMKEHISPPMVAEGTLKLWHSPYLKWLSEKKISAYNAEITDFAFVAEQAMRTLAGPNNMPLKTKSGQISSQ